MEWRCSRRAGLATAWLLASGARAQAGEQPLVTVVDGQAQLIQGLNKLELLEGQRLAEGDILRVAPAAQWLRIEWSDGRQLSLGPGSELLLAPRLPARRGRPAAYLLRGWVKTALPLAAPGWDLQAPGGDYVLRLDAEGLALFAESGALQLVEGRKPALAVASGGFVRQRQGKRELLARPAADFIAGLPRPFLDRLPPRHARVAGAKPQPKALGRPGYEDLQGWLSTEAELRQALLRRWQPLAQGDFRRALEKNLSQHREWEPLLFPERFRPQQ